MQAELEILVEQAFQNFIFLEDHGIFEVLRISSIEYFQL